MFLIALQHFWVHNKMMDKLKMTPAPNPLISKGVALWRQSRIWAPLPERDDLSRMHPEVHEENKELDLSHLAPSAPDLDSACLALEPRLPEGMTLRALGRMPGDREALANHWMGLGVEGMRTRFFYLPSEHVLRARAKDLDFVNPRFAGIFDKDGSLACVAEWAFEPSDNEEAEAAFSTHEMHRRKGLAKIAAAACAIDARSKGVKRLRIDTLRENSAAQHLATSLGGAREAGSPDGYQDAVSSFIDLTRSGEHSIEARIGLPYNESNLRIKASI